MYPTCISLCYTAFPFCCILIRDEKKHIVEHNVCWPFFIFSYCYTSYISLSKKINWRKKYDTNFIGKFHTHTDVRTHQTYGFKAREARKKETHIRMWIVIVLPLLFAFVKVTKLWPLSCIKMNIKEREQVEENEREFHHSKWDPHLA